MLRSFRAGVGSTHRGRLGALQDVLAAYGEIWRPAPFLIRRPAWCATYPELAEELLGLDDASVERLRGDAAAARAWLAARLPEVRGRGRAAALEDLETLERLAPLTKRTPRAGTPMAVERRVPGRKRAQLDAFVASIPPSRAPVLDWCAGKGYLGRRLALADGVAVCSVDRDPVLGGEARTLARSAGIPQTVVTADALQARAQAYARNRTVVALHACGELHRALVRRAASAGAYGYRIAPCCYHLGVRGSFRPVSRYACLPLGPDLLRLAVTETVTARSHDRRRLVRDQTWKLGFLALRDEFDPAAPSRQGRPRTVRPVPGRWLAAGVDFPAFVRALADREGLRLPARVDWAAWLAVGVRRRAEVRRLEVVRHVFRRALELWLVYDLAVGLEEAGFGVRVGTFCPRAVSPRNLLVLADR